MNENYNNSANKRSLLAGAFDIALLRLETEVDLSLFTPACLARANDTTTFNYEKALSLGEKPPLPPCLLIV